MKRPTAVIDEVWIQRAHDAFRASIDASGAHTKTMACWMQEAGFWPATLTVDSAVTKFRHCLAGTHGERFRTLELIALCVQFGGDALLRFWAESAGFGLVEIPDAAFNAQLVAGFDDRLAQMEQLLGEMRSTRALIEARNQYDAREQARSGARGMFAKDSPL